MYLKRILILVILSFMPLQLLALDVPMLTGHVNDYARMLSPEEAAKLEQKLAAFERDTSTQIVVLTIPSLQGDEIEPFAIRVADQWKIGQKGKDNGVLLILAQAEHKVRIEVGMGLQGVLPDITAGQIIRNIMAPLLKANNYDQAVSAGTDAIISATKGEFKASPQVPHRKPRSNSLTFFLLTAVAAVILGSYSRYLGGVAGAAGLPLAAFFAFPGVGLVMLLILAAAGFAGGILLSALFSSTIGGGGGGGGGFYMGGGGFGGGGFSSGDGGFSGGGGGFDGGGASGDW